MRTVHEVSKLSGVSVRALHHYDAIGLLKPAASTAAGYRLYDDAALERLQQILLLRELEFPLREIKSILDRPDFDPKAALEQQIELLELKIEHLQRLIALARDTIQTGGTAMNFSAFDKTDFERYAAEAKQRWGATAAYQEFQQKGASPAAAAEMMQLFAQMGGIRHLSPASDEAQAAIQALQQFITDHFYTCTLPILRGLGQMYVTDQRFKDNIDGAGGMGTAAFISKAIEIYCQK